MQNFHVIKKGINQGIKTAIKSTVMIGMLGLGLVAAGTSAVAGMASMDTKRIHVSATDNTAHTDKLIVSFDPVKPSHRVGEPIRFNVRSNKGMYLYVFNVDKKTGDSVLLLPNRLQKDNFYPGNRTLRVPDRGVEFFSDRAGYEEVIMVASTKKVSLNTDRYKNVGEHFYGTSRDNLYKEFSNKGIVLNYKPNRPEPRHDIAHVNIQKLNLRIVGGSSYNLSNLFTEPHSAVASPVAFVSTSGTEYRAGSQVDVVYGANKSGYVHLYSVEPDGTYERLRRISVDGKSFYQLSLRAGAPYGEHRVVAVYTKGKNIDDTALNAVFSRRHGKALVVAPASADYDLVMDSKRIWITR